jgi:MarR family transcriptional regulator, transcriptional regulator for hemolysin
VTTRQHGDRAVLENAFIGSIGALHRELRRVYDRQLGPSGLSLAHAWPVVLIAEHAGMRQRELAERLDVEGPTLVRLLHQLAAMGLVMRKQDPDDQRANAIHLTAAGQATARRVRRTMDAVRARLLADVSDDELAESLRVFEALREAMSTDDAKQVSHG